MTSLTVKLPESLNRKIRSVARSRGEKVSVLARRALQNEVTEAAPDFVRMAEQYKGMFTGAKDLSSREGYGSRDDR
jgi:predicted transcriptional regulator